MKIAKFMANMLINTRENARQETLPSIQSVDNRYDFTAQWELGTNFSVETAPRTRKQIYTQWQIMQADPQIAEALSLHVTAALGGHETTGDVIFITPHERVRGKGQRSKALYEKVERESKKITPIINRMAYPLARQAVGYGDSYARIYTHKDKGVIDLVNNEYTAPPLIQSFEQGGRTIGFFALEQELWTDVIAKLTPMQLLRVKMPRIEYVPQMILNEWQVAKQLEYDIQSDMPILPSSVGGSFLYPIEEPWKKAMENLLALNNQQIADSVNQTFLSINMEGMPPNQQKKYKQGLIATLQKYRDRIKTAFESNTQIYGPQYHILPTWGDKQTITPLGDIFQKQSNLSTDTLMINLRRVAGGLGIDMSMTGWADMLTGGLGDGAAFHTSAQIMRRSSLIRQALIDAFNDLMALHWGIKYGEFFQDGEYPWQFDFYSDQSAATTEALTNKQTRLNTTLLKTQALAGLKELGLGKQSLQLILENDMGEDYDTAKTLTDELLKAQQQAQEQAGMGGFGMPTQDEPPTDDEIGYMDDETDGETDDTEA